MVRSVMRLPNDIFFINFLDDACFQLLFKSVIVLLQKLLAMLQTSKSVTQTFFT